ncbi:MAG: ATP-binding protein [Gemmatimonadota bacterium]|nr:ATP-binding protein [Gemmatimonadota bacterium]
MTKSDLSDNAPAPSDRIGIVRTLPESANETARGHCRDGDSALETGDLAGAEGAYRAALSVDAGNVRARHNLGVVYYRLGRWGDALPCFTACLDLAPDQAADMRFKMGLCRVKGGFNGAQQDFEAATENDPDHLEAHFQWALLRAEGANSGSRGRQQAVEALRYILDAVDRGVRCCNVDGACFLLASFLDDLPENTDEAISVYRRGLEANPLFAPGHNNLGVLLMQNGQTLQALGAFKIAIQLEPDYALPYRNLAHLLFDCRSSAQMEQEYTTIIEEFGAKAASVLARLSLELIDMGRVQVGESLYTRGHQIKNLMGLVGSRTRRLIRRIPKDNAVPDGLREIARDQEHIYDQWVAYLRSMKQDPLNPTLVDIRQLLRNVRKTVSGRTGGTLLRFAFEPQVPQVKVDPGMLREAVTNLILNALDAVDEDGAVTVQAGYDNKRASVFIEVEDDGPGISEEIQGRIFDPGFSTKEKGNGFGLSICSRIVSAHRGNLRMISRPGAGAVFRIDIPVDFELVSESESIGWSSEPIDASRLPLAEEFIE